MTASAATAMLERMEDVLEPATHAMVTDSARAVWDQTGLPDEVRAYSAYLLALRYGAEATRDQSVTWARRAVDLDPGNEDYRDFLRLIGGERP